MADGDRAAVLTAIDAGFARHIGNVFDKAVLHRGDTGSKEVIEDALDRALRVRDRMIAYATTRV